jgi:hypothetical protein
LRNRSIKLESKILWVEDLIDLLNFKLASWFLTGEPGGNAQGG